MGILQDYDQEKEYNSGGADESSQLVFFQTKVNHTTTPKETLVKVGERVNTRRDCRS